MFINRVSRRLLAAPEMAPLLRELSAGNDATLAVAQSARPLVLAALCPGTRVRAVLGGTVLPCTERAPGAWEVTVPHGLKNAVVELRPE